MSIDAITLSDDSRLIVPESSDDWAGWVSATRTRNYVLGHPLLDWLEVRGHEQGFERDTALPDSLLHEPSGLAASRVNPDVQYVHSESDVSGMVAVRT